MDTFKIEIAQLTARVQPMFFSTREYCRSYLSDRDPDIFIEVTAADLAYEQKMLEAEAIEEGLRIRKFTDPFLERATIQRRYAEALLARNTLLVHGSTVGVDGFAYLFAAPCGTGKSTHTKLWRDAFGSRALMINDDKPFLKVTSSGVTAYGSPWSGKHGLDTNVALPLRGICLLQRGTVNKIHRINSADCIDELLHYSFIPEDEAGRKTGLALVKEMCDMVPIWKLECTKDPSAALVSYNAMSQV